MSDKPISSFDINKAAYGGEGWSPRIATHQQEIGKLWGACGINSEWGKLKSVLLYPPSQALISTNDLNAAQLLAPINLPLAQQQHSAIAQAYQANGVTVHTFTPPPNPTPNQMFVADLMFMTPAGAIVARPASTVRAGEERWVAQKLAELGVPIFRTLHGTATFEGADAAWVNPETVLIGRGLRTNDAGTQQVADAVRALGATAIIIDLPFGTMHMMGMLRIVDKDLALAWPHRLVHRGVDALRERGFQVAFCQM